MTLDQIITRTKLPISVRYFPITEKGPRFGVLTGPHHQRAVWGTVKTAEGAKSLYLKAVSMLEEREKSNG